MKARIIVSIITVLALAVSLIPGMAYAGVEGVVGGAFTLGNIAPTINAVILLESGNGNTATMSPQNEYVIRVNVTDANSLDDLSIIEVTLYYDEDGVYSIGTMPVAGDTYHCAIFRWTNAGDSWQMDSGGGTTTWSITTAKCSAPNMLATTGDFDFYFVPGKVARWNEGNSEWHIYAIAYDPSTSAAGYNTDYTMNWYGEISYITPNVHWQSVSFNDSDIKSDVDVAATIIANGNYSGQIKSSTPWTIIGNVSASAALVTGDPGDKQFSLKAEGTGNLGSAISVTSDYTKFSSGGGITADLGYNYAHNALWISIGESGLFGGTYTGTITYKIITRTS